METVVSPELWLRTILIRNGLTVGDEALELLGRYADALLRANKSVNLISRRDEENLWQHHILHSLSILFLFQFQEGCRVLDLGSGGGLPGIPLRIMVPSLRLTMVDSTKKKISAVESIVTDLELKGTRGVWARAEDLARDQDFEEQFDVVLARAVGSLEDLARLARPLLKKTEANEPRDGRPPGPMLLDRPCLVAYKGGAIEGEVEKARRIRYVRSVRVSPLVFKGSDEMALEDKKIAVIQFT